MRKFLFWATIIVTGAYWLGSHQKDTRPIPPSVSPSFPTPSSASDPPVQPALETEPATKSTQAAPQLTTVRLLFVRGKGVALRGGPGKTFPIIDQYDSGREVTVLESLPDWSHIRDNLTQKDGWISSNLLSESKPEGTVKRETRVPQEAPPKPKIAIPDISKRSFKALSRNQSLFILEHVPVPTT